MRYVSPYHQKLNESIGRGSVLLIKGRPVENGRHLYVTQITGYAEIKPGIKMVFLGDQIYRVKYRDGNFIGKKVYIKQDENLASVLNLKNPERPSIVLNHNKTPFHWSTLKHTDIGTALRELGPGLFDHDLILEQEEIEGAESDNWEEEKKRLESDGAYRVSKVNEYGNLVIGHLLDAMLNNPSNLEINDIDMDERGAYLESNPKPYEDAAWSAEVGFDIKYNKIKGFSEEDERYLYYFEFLNPMSEADAGFMPQSWYTSDAKIDIEIDYDDYSGTTLSFRGIYLDGTGIDWKDLSEDNQEKMDQVVSVMYGSGSGSASSPEDILDYLKGYAGLFPEYWKNQMFKLNLKTFNDPILKLAEKKTVNFTIGDVKEIVDRIVSIAKGSDLADKIDFDEYAKSMYSIYDLDGDPSLKAFKTANDKLLKKNLKLPVYDSKIAPPLTTLKNLLNVSVGLEYVEKELETETDQIYVKKLKIKEVSLKTSIEKSMNRILNYVDSAKIG
jgi:hypothetical protein